MTGGAPVLARVAIRARPNARQSAVISYQDQVLRVDLAAPPADGRANDELVRLLARGLAIPRSRVRLIRGAGDRRKVVEIDLPPDQVARWLETFARGT